MKVKVKQNGMLIDATISMRGDMMVVIPITEKAEVVNLGAIKNGQVITLAMGELRYLYMANMVSIVDAGLLVHYHAAVDCDGELDKNPGQIYLSPYILDKPTKQELNLFNEKLAYASLIWDEENGCLANFNDGDIVVCESKEDKDKWVCACKYFELFGDRYYVEDYCGHTCNSSDDRHEVWAREDYSDAATSIRLATTAEKESFNKKLAKEGYAWNKDTLKLEWV